MNTKSRLAVQWLGYFSLTLLPSALVLGFFLFNRMVNQYVLVVSLAGAVFGTFMAIKTVETMRGLHDDDKTAWWLQAAASRDRGLAQSGERDAENEKLLDELRGRKDARLPASSNKPAHWRDLDDAALQGQVARLLKKLGRRVQRTGDADYRGFDLVVDNNAIVKCSAQPKRQAEAAAKALLATFRAQPACSVAVLVWPKGFPARTRYLARGTDLILWDADNIARLVEARRLT